MNIVTGGGEEVHGSFKGHFEDGRCVMGDAASIEGSESALVGHVVGNEAKMSEIDGNSIVSEYVLNLLDDGLAARFDAVMV